MTDDRAHCAQRHPDRGRDPLAASGRLFDRGMPGRIIKPADAGPPSATRTTKRNVVIETHRLCQPAKFDPQGDRKPSFEKWAEWRSPNAAFTVHPS
jgi:hypothetical protein